MIFGGDSEVVADFNSEVEFEDDAPNYTPRISAVMHIEKDTFNYAVLIFDEIIKKGVPYPLQKINLISFRQFLKNLWKK